MTKSRISILSSGLKAVLMLAIAVLAACDRGGDGVPQPEPDFVGTDDPNRFIQFLNAQVGLPAGEYTIVAGTDVAGENGSFTISVMRDNFSYETFTGSWTNSGGRDADPLNNPSFNFEMPYSGGATITIDSTVDTCLYLLDPGGTVMAGGGTGLCSRPTTIKFAKSKINLASNAAAYYEAIDPNNTRNTLEKWMEANNFGEPCGVIDPCETHVIFRDTKDLGYGRDMYARRNDDGSFAVFVRNFRVDAVPGLQYSTLNLDAAISNNTDPTRERDIQWHFGSNAIEFSTYPYGVGEPRENYAVDNLGGQYNTNGGGAPMFTKYFTFKPDDVNDPNTTERRLNVVDLDSRGEKSMPGPCISCHGGMSRPLLPDGSYPPPIPGGVPGDTQAQMQVIEVSTVTFSDEPGWTCSDLISGVNFINQGVLSSYEVVGNQYNGILGYWQPDFAADLIEGWYGEDGADRGDFTIPNRGCGYLQNDFYDYVPVGWRPNSTAPGMPPAGADDLFREVIAPNCMVCHSRRGVNLGPDGGNFVMQDVDFSTYEKFLSYSEHIERFIFDKGVMPLGLLNFDAFWDNSGPGRAELLASHIPDFSRVNGDGEVLRPGRPIAVAAAPRNTNVPVTLSAEGSSFANSYRWTIVERVTGSNPTLTGADTARPVFNTDLNGDYKLRLVVSKNGRSSKPVTVEIAVSSLLPLPSSLRFDPDIKNVLQNFPTDCEGCHASVADGGVEGVPLHYTDAQVEGRDLYQGVYQRINFKEPIESLLLRKPSGHHHYGGCLSGFDLTDDPGDCSGADDDRSNYDLFLNWILQGAPR
jgi:mono/diheme cytochrome c family protein